MLVDLFRLELLLLRLLLCILLHFGFPLVECFHLLCMPLLDFGRPFRLSLELVDNIQSSSSSS